MKGLKLKKVLVCLNLVFFVSLCSAGSVDASDVNSVNLASNNLNSLDEQCGKSDSDNIVNSDNKNSVAELAGFYETTSFNEENFLEKLDSLKKFGELFAEDEKITYKNKFEESKNFDENVETKDDKKAKAIFDYVKFLDKFYEDCLNKRIDYRNFSSSFVDCLKEKNKLFFQLAINHFKGKSDNANLEKLEAYILEFEKKHDMLFNYVDKNSRDFFVEFEKEVSNTYGIFIKIKEEFNRNKNLSLDDGVSKKFFDSLKKTTYCLQLILKEKTNEAATSANRFFTPSILECFSKLFCVVKDIEEGNTVGGLYGFLGLCSNSNNRNIFLNFVNSYDLFEEYINSFLYRKEVIIGLNNNRKFWCRLKLLYTKLCLCRSIEEFDIFFTDFKSFLDSFATTYSKFIDCENVNGDKNSDVDLGSFDYTYYIHIVYLLKTVNRKIEEFLKNKRCDIYNSTIDKLKKIIEPFEKGGLNSCATKVFGNLKEFDSDFDSIYVRLCDINKKSYEDACYGRLNNNRIKSYLNELNLIFGPLKLKLSRNNFYNFEKCYDVLKGLNDRFKFAVDSNFKDDNLDKLSVLTYLCEIFSNSNRVFGEDLFHIVLDLNNRLNNFKNNSESLNFEILQDLDLILSFFETVDSTESPNIDNSNSKIVKYKCYDILFNKNSNISKFLNSLIVDSEESYNKINNYFEEIDCFQSKYSSIFVNLEQPSVKCCFDEGISSYGRYVIRRLKRLRTNFFDGFKVYCKYNLKKNNLKMQSSKESNEKENILEIISCYSSLLKLLQALGKEYRECVMHKCDNKNKDEKKSKLLEESKILLDNIHGLLSNIISLRYFVYFSSVYDLCKSSFDEYEAYFSKFV